MSMENPLIEIVIPNWNGRQMLAHCLSSLEVQTNRNFCVTVVDNGSEDGSLELLENEFPKVRLLRFTENRGFSVAVNRGIRKARASWILLLNNDMEVAPDCLEHLIQGIEKYKKYDFFALKMINFNNRDFLDGAGDAVLRGGVGYRLGTMEKDSDMYRVDRDVFGACGGGALYSRKFFDKVGLFDNVFFAYLEDVDLNLRARRLGMRCRYLSSAMVFHIGSATTGKKVNAFTIRLSTRNNFAVVVKNYSFGMALRFLFPFTIYQFAWLLFVVKKRMFFSYCRGILETFRLLPEVIGKRREILADPGNILEKEFRRAVVTSEKEAVESIMARRSAEGKTNLLFGWYCRIFF
ncbi:glycosyl transferase [Desulfomarina profundi]|uniref:Glycosyl transferase n=1 Tax=Desulfomarina profundi TaxID=2772557 RepID=A0A8D5FFY7_9BACT|nr:glycosyltransferase family 2 protein [Desulfomarina profundi]BCL60942.1 glycosyl transferase [Desulfomarina profundi]